MRLARRDVRDHIASQKNDHGASYPRYRALQQRSRLDINICEILGVVRFSTFATLSGVEQTSQPDGPTSENEPNETLGCTRYPFPNRPLQNPSNLLIFDLVGIFVLT